MGKVTDFFKDSYSELRKVVWPSREQVVASTKVVLLSMVLIALVLGAVDLGLAAIVSRVL